LLSSHTTGRTLFNSASQRRCALKNIRTPQLNNDILDNPSNPPVCHRTRRLKAQRYLEASCVAVAACISTLTAHGQTLPASQAGNNTLAAPTEKRADTSPSASPSQQAHPSQTTPSKTSSQPLQKIPPVPQALTGRGHGPGRNNQYLLRFDEDYSYLHDPAASQGELPYKFIPLNADRSSWLTLLGGERLYFDHNNMNVVKTPASSVNEFEARTTLGADLHLGSHFRFYLEGINGQYVGPSALHSKIATDLGVFNAFAEIMDQVGSMRYGVRLGRQELWLGNGLVICNRDLANIPTSWNGARAYADWGSGRVDIFSMVPTLYVTPALSGKLSTGLHLTGIYGSFGLPAGRLGSWPLSSSIDPFFIRYSADSNSYQDADMLVRGPGRIPHFAQGPDVRNSFGLRYYGGLGPIDFDYTGVFQTGSTAGDIAKAWMFTTQTDYVWRNLNSQPRIGLRFDGASGGASGTPGQGQISTYQLMYAMTPYYGDGLPVTQANMVDFAPRASINFDHNTRLDLTSSFYYRQNQSDAIYSGLATTYNAFNPYFRTAKIRGRYIGSMPEAILHWRQSRYQLLTFTLAYFMPGGALKKIGGKNTVYAQIQSMMLF